MKTKKLNSNCECGHSKTEHTKEGCSECDCEGYNKIEEDKKQEPILIQYIKDRVENRNKNFVMLFVGATGSGKSLSALRLAEMLDDTFDIQRVNFKAKDFMNTINGLVERSEKGEVIKGKVIMWDEFGVEHNAREFMTISNRVINYFFQTSRHLNLIVIMTVPLLSFIDSATRKLMHGVAEMQGINMREKTATVRVKMIQTNVMTGKEYPKYLRYRKKNRLYALRKIKVNMPSPELRGAYEIKKKQFTTQLNKEIMNKLERVEAKDISENDELTRIILQNIPKHSSVGISAAGDIDEEELIVKTSPHSKIKEPITFARTLKDKGCDVAITNDMRAAAQGAARFGEGKGYGNVCVATYSTGFNAAVVRNLVNVTTAEIGHLVYDSTSTLFCGCGGRGHLDTYVSGTGAAMMAKQYFVATNLRHHSIISRVDGRLDAITSKEVYDAFLEKPDEEPQRSIQAIQVEAIAHSFGLIVSAYNPLDVIVLMGSMTKAEEQLFRPARGLYQGEKGRFQLHSLNVPEIVTTALPEIGVQGAAAYVLAQREHTSR